MAEHSPAEKWHVRSIHPGVPGLERLSGLGLPDFSHLSWLKRAVRPADIGGVLRDAMLARENMLEDVNYLKVVPNRYVVEVSESNYARQFLPIEAQILQQWRDRLLEELVTANSRQGRKEFRMGGRLRMEVRPAADLRDSDARVLCRVEADAPPPGSVAARVVPASQIAQHPVGPLTTAARPPADLPSAPLPTGPLVRPAAPEGGQPAAALELAPGGRRWALFEGINTIGRSETCTVHLDLPLVQEKRLISGRHAYILIHNGACMLYDGSPDGRPSANGTYVNLRRVLPAGHRLQDGDAIVLAALDPLYPRSDTPGVATVYFWLERGG